MEREYEKSLIAHGILSHGQVFSCVPSPLPHAPRYRSASEPRVSGYLQRQFFYRVLKGFHQECERAIMRGSFTPFSQKGRTLESKKLFNKNVAKIMGPSYLRDYYRYKFHIKSNLDSIVWCDDGVMFNDRAERIERINAYTPTSMDIIMGAYTVGR